MIHLLVSPTCLIIGIEKKIHNCNITIYAKFIFNNRAICLVILFLYKNFTIYNCPIIYCYFNMTQIKKQFNFLCAIFMFLIH